MGDCSCRICLRHKKIEQAIEGKNVETLSNMVRELSDALDHAELDEDYYKIVLSGKWPQSVGILERALERAKEYEKENV